MDHKIEHEGVVYTFTLLTIGQEDEWRDWVRDSKMTEGMASSEGWPMDLRAKFLAEISKSTPLDKCSFLGEIGQQALATETGIAKVLELGLRKAHPNPQVPFETVKKLLEAKTVECGRLMFNILPVSDQVRATLLGEYEKKVATTPLAGLG